MIDVSLSEDSINQVKYQQVLFKTIFTQHFTYRVSVAYNALNQYLSLFAVLFFVIQAKKVTNKAKERGLITLILKPKLIWIFVLKEKYERISVYFFS